MLSLGTFMVGRLGIGTEGLEWGRELRTVFSGEGLTSASYTENQVRTSQHRAWGCDSSQGSLSQ